MQLEYFVQSASRSEALELGEIWESITDYESDGVSELTAAIVSILEAVMAAEGPVLLQYIVVDDHSVHIPGVASEYATRAEEVARVYLYLDGLEDWQGTDKGVLLGYISDEWRYFDFSELQDNAYLVSDWLVFSFDEGDYDQLGRDYVDNFVETVSSIPSIVTDNIDFDGIGNDIAADYQEVTWAGMSYLINV